MNLHFSFPVTDEYCFRINTLHRVLPGDASLKTIHPLRLSAVQQTDMKHLEATAGTVPLDDLISFVRY